MAIINIDFPWARGRTYELVRPSQPVSDNPFAAKLDEPHIRQTGRSEKPERPLLLHPTLYLDLAALKSPDEYLKFARAWGLLDTPAEQGAQERVSVWRSKVRTLKDSVEGLRRAIEEKALPVRGALVTERVEIRLVGGVDNRPALSFRPSSLWDAIRIQLAQSIAGGKSIEVCQFCSKWFEAGGRGGGAKRAKAIFCSGKCRNDFHYQQRRTKQ